MKFIFLILFLALAFILESKAQSDTLVINLKNNQVEKIAISQIQKIQFENVSAIGEQSDVSKSLAVKGNYPNPFRTETNIEFKIATAGNVEVLIYDNNGNQIQKLVCSDCKEGRNVLQWNSLDKNNNKVQSGIYYYEVHYGKEILSKKMILVK